MEANFEKKSSAQELYEMGSLYRDGHVVNQDYAKAKEYYDQAKLKGCLLSSYEVGNLYLKGGPGLEKAPLRAKAEFKEGAGKGCVASMYGLGMFYRYYYNAIGNFGRAKKYFEQAVKGGHNDALYELGEIYRILTKVDLEESLESKEHYREMALYYYEEALKKDHVKAAIRLREVYEGSHCGFIKNDEKAKYYREKESEIKRKHSE